MAKRRKLKSAIYTPKRTLVHDRVATDIPANAEIIVDEFNDPMEISEAAAPDPDKPFQWKTPDKSKLRAARSIKQDPIGRMKAWNQIGEAEYLAARKLQAIHAAAQIGYVRAIDPFKDVVDGGALPEVLTERQQLAIRQIRRIETELLLKHGRDGLSVTNAVVIARQTIGAFGKGLRYWSELFHQCLQTLGRELGTIAGRSAA